MIICGDALTELKKLPNESVNCCVTSPPYWGLRDYGVEGQLGLEDTPERYTAAMTSVFLEVRRVLRNDGTLWLNLGDSYATGAGKADKPGGRKVLHSKQIAYDSIPRLQPNRLPISGLKPKDLIGIPWRVAFALQSDGWYLRQDIIWNKPNPMPESVRDRCTKAHEYIFLFSKSRKYYFDHDKMKEDAVCGSNGSQFQIGKTGIHQLGRSQKIRTSKPKGSFKTKGEPLPGRLPFRAIVETRNKRSVWTVPTKPIRAAHFATFPPALIEPCILAGCPKDGTVLDPFFGAGTVGLTALNHMRKFIGIELNPRYIKIAEDRLKIGLRLL